MKVVYLFYSLTWEVENLVNRLKDIRESKGFSISRLAKESNVSRQTIYRLESESDDTANSKTLKALADALAVKVTDFFVE